ncbi:MAG: hypothetical protein PHR28_14470, partial [candidate division Zixibacteria bacterium]|nr:hypothetical protein [candidate division Zixibacteria bacterium]
LQGYSNGKEAESTELILPFGSQYSRPNAGGQFRSEIALPGLKLRADPAVTDEAVSFRKTAP